MAPGDVEKCVAAVSNASSYSQRVSALLLLTRVIQTGDYDAEQRRELFRAIGFDLLSRLLVWTGDDSPPSGSDTGPPERVFRSLATALLSALCTVPEFLDDERMAEVVPPLLAVLSEDGGLSGEAMAAKNDALSCLLSLSAHPVSCRSLVRQHGVTGLVQLLSNLTEFADDKQRDFREQVFSVVSSVVTRLGSDSWSDNHDSFHLLLNTMARQMVDEGSARKFKMCDAIRTILASYPPPTNGTATTTGRAAPESADVAARRQPWFADFHRELLGILCFKLSDGQREPLLKLCAMLVQKGGVEWALGTGGGRSQRMFFLLVQLSCVEVRMIVEDQSPEEVMRKSELAASCFIILENAIRFLIQDDGRTVNEQSLHYVYQAITAAFAGILHYLKQMSERGVTANELERLFLLATVRATGAWLAEETAALRDEVYAVLPFLLSLLHPSTAPACFADEEADLFLLFLLPGLGHLSCEDRGRAILSEHRVPELLAERFAGLWPAFLEEESSLSASPSPPPPSEEVGDDAEVVEMSDRVNRLMGICSVLTNVVVLEADGLRERHPELLCLLKFLFRALPDVDRPAHRGAGGDPLLLLRGKMATMGLLLLRRFLDGVKSTETAIYRFLSASVRFLWDAFVVEESSEGASLVITIAYDRVWPQLKEPWYLGMQALSTCLPAMPWVGQFVMESGWADQIVATLCRVDEKGLEGSVKTAYEDFLCCVVRCYGQSVDTLKEHGALRMCTTHKMKHLSRLLRVGVGAASLATSP